MTTPAPLGRQRVNFGPVSVYLGLNNGKLPDCNQMIVEGRDQQIAVDASRSTGLIAEHFCRSDRVVLSHMHEDHVAGLSLVPNLPLEVHHNDLAALQSWDGLVAAAGHSPAIAAELRPQFEADFGYAPQPRATGYGDQAQWDLGGVTLCAIPTPGHTPGHCALLVEEAELLFVGDVDLTSFGPYYGDANSSLEAFRNSIKLLPGIPAKVWVTGHHKGIYTDREVFLAELAAYGRKIDAREARLLGYLAAGPQSLEALVALRLMYPRSFTAFWVEEVERRVILKHLTALMAAGEVLQTEAGYQRA